jgi:hypothetical protein
VLARTAALAVAVHVPVAVARIRVRDAWATTNGKVNVIAVAADARV